MLFLDESLRAYIDNGIAIVGKHSYGEVRISYFCDDTKLTIGSFVSIANAHVILGGGIILSSFQIIRFFATRDSLTLIILALLIIPSQRVISSLEVMFGLRLTLRYYLGFPLQMDQLLGRDLSLRDLLVHTRLMLVSHAENDRADSRIPKLIL